MTRAIALCLVLVGCQRGGDRRDALPAIGSATRVAIGDLDGDGRAEITAVDGARLRVIDRSGRELAAAPVDGGIQALVVADLDGDGAGEIAAGWGRDREHAEARAQVSIFRLESGGALREELVFAPDSSRPQIAAILPRAPDLLIAWYDSQYIVKSAFARREGSGWRLDEVAAIRTAASYALGDVDGDGAPDLLVGRAYGDDQGSDGDAFLLRPDGSRVAIPTTRGVHAIALGDGDGDGRLEVFLADGWHKDYGTRARGLLTWSRWTGGAFRSEVIDELPGEYTIWSLLAADLDGDRHPELIARGSGSVRVYRFTGGAWTGRRVAGSAEDIAAGELDGAPGAELLVAGAHSTWIGGG